VHVHVYFRGASICSVWSPRLKPNNSTMQHANEVIVFVDVPDSGTISRPLASVVRLQGLDCCYMHITDPIKKLLRRPRKSFGVRSIGNCVRLCVDPGVERGELPNQVVEGASEIISRVPNQNATSIRDGDRSGVDFEHLLRCTSRHFKNLSLSFAGNTLTMNSAEFAAQGFEFVQVFTARLDANRHRSEDVTWERFC